MAHWSATRFSEVHAKAVPRGGIQGCRLAGQVTHFCPTASTKTTKGQLKSSQHLGLARLASWEYDRVQRLPLSESTSSLSFRRTIAPSISGRRPQRENDDDTGSFEPGFGVGGEGGLGLRQQEGL